MKALLLPVSTGTSELRHQLDTLTCLEELVRRVSDAIEPEEIQRLIYRLSDPRYSSANRHSFYYRATIVTLYGLLEQFVENLLIEIVRRLCDVVPRYDALPENIKANHLPLTLEVLTRLSTGKYQGKTDERTLINGLNSCYEDSGPFVLNDMVFAYHTANYRAEQVKQSFERIGMRLDLLPSDKSLSDSMDTHFPDERNQFFVIDDLAERRNEVAHGSVSQLLSVELLHSYIDVVESYATALMRSATSSLIKFAIPLMGTELGRPAKVFRHQIAGYSSAAHPLTVGDILAIVDGEGAASCVRIRGLEVERTVVETATAGSSVGIDTGKRLTSRCRLYLFPNSVSFFVLE